MCVCVLAFNVIEQSSAEVDLTTARQSCKQRSAGGRNAHRRTGSIHNARAKAVRHEKLWRVQFYFIVIIIFLCLLKFIFFATPATLTCQQLERREHTHTERNSCASTDSELNAVPRVGACLSGEGSSAAMVADDLNASLLVL